MKRAFIRLFGCILSAIGLSMSYDTTLTVLLDDDSMPGVAYAAESGTGTGSGAGMVIPGTLLAGHTGYCLYDGMNVNYEVYLSDWWYVGWLNLDYAGAGGVPYSKWPVSCDGTARIDLTFSGLSVFTLKGDFVSTDAGTGDYYGSRSTVDLCTGKYGYVIGMATGLGEVTASAFESWRNKCVVETKSPSCTFREYSFGAVYLPAAVGFTKMGCCLVSGSSYATETGCACFYGRADKAYTYTYLSDSHTNKKTTTTTVPFRDIFLDYSYNGCKAGWYSKANIATSTHFVQSLMNDKNLLWDSRVNGGVNENNPCPTSVDSSFLGMTAMNSTTYFTNFWKNCDACYPMTSISNKSSFSPTITSDGTMSMTTSDSGTGIGTCNATVKGAKDATGTFDIVGSCSYQ